MMPGTSQRLVLTASQLAPSQLMEALPITARDSLRTFERAVVYSSMWRQLLSTASTL
jgi:hypothetical protein